jgi:hypothetical protein
MLYGTGEYTELAGGTQAVASCALSLIGWA